MISDLAAETSLDLVEEEFLTLKSKARLDFQVEGLEGEFLECYTFTDVLLMNFVLLLLELSLYL